MNDSHFGAVEELDAEFYIYHVLADNVRTEIHHHSSAQLVYAEGGIVHVFTDLKPVSYTHLTLPTNREV